MRSIPTSLQGWTGPLALLLILFAVLTDQMAKIRIRSSYVTGEFHPLIGDLIGFQLYWNRGTMLAMFDGIPAVHKLFAFSSAAIIGVCFYLYHRAPARRWVRTFPLAMVVGGTIGNGLDRLAYGAVTDFVCIRLSPTFAPNFNLADLFLTIGLVMLVVEQIGIALERRQPSAPHAKPQSAETVTPAPVQRR